MLNNLIIEINDFVQLFVIGLITCMLCVLAFYTSMCSRLFYKQYHYDIIHYTYALRNCAYGLEKSVEWYEKYWNLDGLIERNKRQLPIKSFT